MLTQSQRKIILVSSKKSFQKLLEKPSKYVEDLTYLLLVVIRHGRFHRCHQITDGIAEVTIHIVETLHRINF